MLNEIFLANTFGLDTYVLIIPLDKICLSFETFVFVEKFFFNELFVG